MNSVFIETEVFLLLAKHPRTNELEMEKRQHFNETKQNQFVTYRAMCDAGISTIIAQ